VDDLFAVSNWCRISVYGIQILMKSGTMDLIVLLSYRSPSLKLESFWLTTSPLSHFTGAGNFEFFISMRALLKSLHDNALLLRALNLRMFIRLNLRIQSFVPCNPKKI
jgi:hypothetical protein